MSGKGSKRRPPSVPHDQWAANWDAAFRKKPAGIYWCNVHKREATATDRMGHRRCAYGLGGILLPCDVVLAPMTIE